MASRLVDMVHFSSPVMENNELMRVRAKAKFWDGIVVPYEEVEHYIEEDDVVLIGPGMERGELTEDIVNSYLKQYPHKKWVVDGGALQELDPSLLTESMIITPNYKEQDLLKSKISNSKSQIINTKLRTMYHVPCTILSKGPTDTIRTCASVSQCHCDTVKVTGGSPGLTRGGTGDVLSGLVAGVAAKSDNFAACVIASYTVKKTSEDLALSVGPYFSPNDLVKAIPLTLHQLTQNLQA